jgi:hypothetical protein|tara:strand:+ start:66 stop:191 length:126 start_codon:yes stop_codon:yes gene_type:complete
MRSLAKKDSEFLKLETALKKNLKKRKKFKKKASKKNDCIIR